MGNKVLLCLQYATDCSMRTMTYKMQTGDGAYGKDIPTSLVTEPMVRVSAAFSETNFLPSFVFFLSFVPSLFVCLCIMCLSLLKYSDSSDVIIFIQVSCYFSFLSILGQHSLPIYHINSPSLFPTCSPPFPHQPSFLLPHILSPSPPHQLSLLYHLYDLPLPPPKKKEETLTSPLLISHTNSPLFITPLPHSLQLPSPLSIP